MDNSASWEVKLRQLSQRQCQILYWVCRGSTFKEVAAEIGYGEDLVTAEMSRIYKLFGLTQQRRNVKRRILEESICPLHLQLISDPDNDCRERVIEINAPPPPPSEIQEVVDDANKGLIPLSGALVPLGPRPQAQQEPRRGGTITPRPSYPLIATTTESKGNTALWVLIGVLGTLLVLTCLVIVGLFAIGPEKIAALFQPTSVPSVATVIVTQPPRTVLVTQPAPTAAPSAVITVVVTQPAPTSAPPSAQPTAAGASTEVPAPTTSAETSCTPRGGTVDLAGQVESDIPGTALCVGETVSSVVDSNTKPIDVFAVALVAGQEIQFNLSTNRNCLNYALLNVGSKSVATNQVSSAFESSTCNNRTNDFTPAVSGMYFFEIAANGSGVRYTLNTKPTGQVVPGDQVASDIPGTPLNVGGRFKSVVDSNTKPYDVYAILLTAGQGVRFVLTTNGNCVNYGLLNPGSKSIQTNQVSYAFESSTCNDRTNDYTPAVSGAYYLEVAANGSGVVYQVASTPFK